MNTHLGYLLAISLAYTLVTGLSCAKHTLLAKQAYFSQRKNLRLKYILETRMSYENGCSPKPNRTPKGVRSLML